LAGNSKVNEDLKQWVIRQGLRQGTILTIRLLLSKNTMSIEKRIKKVWIDGAPLKNST